MGTQQILLIVLSVIIVGIAVVVGIMMFNSQAYNANKQAVAAEITTYGSMIVQWWKTPKAQGGAGQDGIVATNPNFTIPVLADYIGFGDQSFSNANGLLNEDVGQFAITALVAGAAPTATITGYGKEVKGAADLSPKVVTLITLPNGIMTATASDETNPW